MVPAVRSGCFVRTDSSACKSFLWLSVLQVPHCLSFRRGSMTKWADSTSRSMTWTERRPAPFFKEAACPEISGDEFWILEDDRCIDTGVFQRRYLLHEMVFACSQPPLQQPRISYTILTQVDCSAVRAAARCETVCFQLPGQRGRVRVCSGEVGDGSARLSEHEKGTILEAMAELLLAGQDHQTRTSSYPQLSQSRGAPRLRQLPK